MQPLIQIIEKIFKDVEVKNKKELVRTIVDEVMTWYKYGVDK